MQASREMYQLHPFVNLQNYCSLNIFLTTLFEILKIVFNITYNLKHFCYDMWYNIILELYKNIMFTDRIN